jgi:hypothetical protein
MFRKLTTLLILTVSVTVSAPVNADNTPSSNVEWPLTYRPGTVGFSSLEDFSNDWQAFSRIFVFHHTEQLCASFDDPYCVPISQPYGIQLLQILPPCDGVTEEADCIEGVTVSDGSKELDSKLIRQLPYSHFSADAKNGIPEGGAPSLWTNPFVVDSNQGLVVTTSAYMKRDTTGPFHDTSFAASIKSYLIKQGDYSPIKLVPASKFTPGETGYLSYTGNAPGCVWTDTGKCGVQTTYPGIKSISLRVKLSNTQTGWLAGRLVNPNVKVEKITSTQNLLTVNAEPASVAMVSASVSEAKATEEMKRHYFADGYQIRSFNIDELSKLLDIYKSVTNDTSTKIIPMWSITNGYGKSTDPCLQSTTNFVGLVTTNSVAYQTEAPKFSRGSLNYTLASPHFQPNGDPFEGTYDLLLSSSAARCLYNYSSAPLTASVTITNEGGSTQVATSTLQESDGWLRLDVKGFHFSKPTIEVALKQEKTTVESTPLPTPSPTRAMVGSKKSSIICIKGKISRVTTNIKPICPTGWIKK